MRISTNIKLEGTLLYCDIEDVVIHVFTITAVTIIYVQREPATDVLIQCLFVLAFRNDHLPNIRKPQLKMKHGSKAENSLCVLLLLLLNQAMHGIQNFSRKDFKELNFLKVPFCNTQA